MRDRQNPRPEFSLFPPEGGKVAGNLEEHLAGQVLGLVGTPASQVPEHEGSQVTVQSRPRPLGSTQGGLEHLGEALAQTHLDSLPLVGPRGGAPSARATAAARAAADWLARVLSEDVGGC